MCSGETFKDGKTLYVRAATSTIKQELSLKKASVLQKINSLKKCRSVKFLKFLNLLLHEVGLWLCNFEIQNEDRCTDNH